MNGRGRALIAAVGVALAAWAFIAQHFIGEIRKNDDEIQLLQKQVAADQAWQSEVLRRLDRMERALERLEDK